MVARLPKLPASSVRARWAGCCGPGARAPGSVWQQAARAMQADLSDSAVRRLRTRPSVENVGFASRHCADLRQGLELCPRGFDSSASRPHEEPGLSLHTAGRTFPRPYSPRLVRLRGFLYTRRNVARWARSTPGRSHAFTPGRLLPRHHPTFEPASPETRLTARHAPFVPFFAFLRVAFALVAAAFLARATRPFLCANKEKPAQGLLPLRKPAGNPRYCRQARPLRSRLPGGMTQHEF